MNETFSYLWTNGRGLYILLLLLFFGIFVAPLLISTGVISDVFIELVFASILIAGVFATPCKAPIRLGMLGLVTLSAIARVVHKFNRSDVPIAITDNILAALSLVVFSGLIIRHFLLKRCPLSHRITAAVAVYLLFGALWARLFQIVHLCNPAAFSLSTEINPFSLLYFSFVTLITIGYGDIAPVSIAARSLAILEGVVGQLYIVILVTSLVSEFSALSVKSAEEKR